MGQGQSSSGGGAGAAAQEVKTSYYTLLGIERTATEEEIKKAYRRKALELHPDRNYGNEEAATKEFAEVQAAHEVLSDPQERAWYDSHESAILRGNDPSGGDGPSYQDVKVTTTDDIIRILGKFNRNVEFTDSPSGFFGYLRETFEHLAKEEELASDYENVEFREYPTFGHRDDEYGDVVKQFYSAWSNFSTAKSFAWVDKWRLSEAPDRWVRRRMEQDNLKMRKDAKQEFNDAVRSLVQFIKKRDPRFISDTRTDEQREKALRDAVAAQRKRQQEANAAKSNQEVPDWVKSREPDPTAELEGTFSESEEDELVFECVACNKIFKSEKQMDAHEKSKKHQKAIMELQKRMRKQNAHLGLDEETVSSGVATPDAEDDEEQEVVDDLAAETEDLDLLHTNGDVDDVDQVGDVLESDQVDDDDKLKAEVSGDESHAEDAEEPEAKAEETNTPANQSEQPTDSEDEDYASRATVEARLASATVDTPTTGASEDDAQPGGKKKMGKAAQKRAKKAAAASAAVEEQSEGGHMCVGCKEQFPSKTKLFDHLKQNPKHVGSKSVTAGGGGGKGKKKGKK